jgi:hypothetical protein
VHAWLGCNVRAQKESAQKKSGSRRWTPLYASSRIQVPPMMFEIVCEQTVDPSTAGLWFCASAYQHSRGEENVLWLCIEGSVTLRESVVGVPSRPI